MTESLPPCLADTAATERTREKLVRLAWFRYRIAQETAEDVVQTAITAYLEVRHRYRTVADQSAILVGIFRKKCLEYIDGSVREQRKLRRYCDTADAARENPWIRPRTGAQAPSVLEQLVRNEERVQILEAISELRPSSRSLVALIIGRDLGRKELIRHLKINKNTLDSRLHVSRRELRGLLSKRDIMA